MPIEIRPISTKKEIRDFVVFPDALYARCPYYCPSIHASELLCFDPTTNPSLDVCEVQLYMAYNGASPVGRIAAFINREANRHWHKQDVRFGWMDFVDDTAVSQALLDAVCRWGKERGMTAMNGPVGFTDWDHQGLLLEGYDYLAPLASLYNYPYYDRHLTQYGLKKEVDWIEYQITPPDTVSERLKRTCRIVTERSRVHIEKYTSATKIIQRYGYSFMDVLDQAYRHIYNFQPLTERQKRYYCDIYLKIINMDFVPIVVNEQDEIVAIGVGMPDISAVVRRCAGRILPFGWWHMHKALKAKRFDTFDLLLIGVRPDYQDKGIPALIFADMIRQLNRYGVKTVETTAMLENNRKILNLFDDFQKVQHKRRRAYTKPL